MSSKAWNDVVGVGRGLWSVIQKAQTSNVRIQRAPRQPSYHNLEAYSQPRDTVYEESTLPMEQSTEEMHVRFEEIARQRDIQHQNEEIIVEVPPEMQEAEIKGPAVLKNQTRTEDVIVDSQVKQKTTPKVSVNSVKKQEKKIEKEEVKVEKPIISHQKDREEKAKSEKVEKTFKVQEPEKVSQDANEKTHEEFIKEIEEKEKDLDYEDTPFYLRQDRPVFSGKETRIPTSPTARAFHFGALGVSIVGGTISEAFKQNLGFSKPLPEMMGGSGLKRYAMTDSNSNRLSNTLCKMRGAALKIGQILSNTEEAVIPKSIQQAFDKARQRADIMPKYQVTEMLDRNIGYDWQKKFSEFSLYPLAAASIGQVHEAKIKGGAKVAVKIQYPNIEQSIDSDFKNFKRLLNVLGIVPEKLYLDELMQNVSEELREECNYLIEAEKQELYKKLLDTDEYRNDFYVPQVYRELSNKHIITQEFIYGIPVDELYKHSQDVRDRVGTLLLKLCIHELFLFKFMQTDPNPANFYYDQDTKRINLIDMGAARKYEDRFVDNYFQIVYGATANDKERIIEYSKVLGFLTGEENRQMLEAHSKSAMFIGEPFKHEGPFFDFGDSDISKRLMSEIPVMLKNRLSPPPQEVYSLHRKLSGAYFLCIKLRSRVNSRDLFKEVSDRFIRDNNFKM